MTSTDLLAAMSGKDHDRIPLYLFDVTLGMEIAGIDTDSVFVPEFNGERSARSLLALNRHLRTDGVNGSVIWYDARLFGADVVYTNKGIPYIRKSALKDDTSALYRMDPNISVGRFTEELVRSYTMVRDGTDAALFHHVPSPLGASSSLRGLENILMDMILEDGFVKDLLGFSQDSIKAISEMVYDEVPIDVTLISGAYDNIDILGYDLLDEFSIDPLRRELSFIDSYGSLKCFHPHGELSSDGAEPLLKELYGLDIDTLYFGENNDPLKIHDIIPKIPLMGGIDTFTTIVLGDDGRVRRDTESFLSRMGGMDYVFSCSCSVDRGLPLRKIEIMAETVKNTASLKS